MSCNFGFAFLKLLEMYLYEKFMYYNLYYFLNLFFQKYEFYRLYYLRWHEDWKIYDENVLIIFLISVPISADFNFFDVHNLLNLKTCIGGHFLNYKITFNKFEYTSCNVNLNYITLLLRFSHSNVQPH